jgi:hypothetical protein
VPFLCPSLPDQDGGAIGPWWPFGKGSGIVDEVRVVGGGGGTGALRWMLASPSSSCSRRSKSSSDL